MSCCSPLYRHEAAWPSPRLVKWPMSCPLVYVAHIFTLCDYLSWRPLQYPLYPIFLLRPFLFPFHILPLYNSLLFYSFFITFSSILLQLNILHCFVSFRTSPFLLHLSHFFFHFHQFPLFLAPLQNRLVACHR